MPDSKIQVQKTAIGLLRGRLRSRRKQISTAERTRLDENIRRHLRQYINITGPVSVAAFWPFDGEPDILPLCRQLRDGGVDIVLPVVSQDRHHTMDFHGWHAGTQLDRNRYGIFEPQHSVTRAIDSVDLLIMPLVGYDRRGNRLGMGHGYYDRHLQSLRDAPKPVRIGVAYGCQEVTQISSNSWDVPLHGVVNEHGWFIFDSRYSKTDLNH